jgi:hypothetical protein
MRLGCQLAGCGTRTPLWWSATARGRSSRPVIRAAAMVREIEASPLPDGVFKRAAPPPFKSGTIVAIARRLAVRYAIEADGLRFYRVQLVDPQRRAAGRTQPPELSAGRAGVPDPRTRIWPRARSLIRGGLEIWQAPARSPASVAVAVRRARSCLHDGHGDISRVACGPWRASRFAPVGRGRRDGTSRVRLASNLDAIRP